MEILGKEVVLSGTIIRGPEMEPFVGYLCLKKGIITEIGPGQVDADLDGIICPRFVNAHTHLGDSVIKDPPYMPLAELVGPGGLKHRTLAATPRSALVEGMRRSMLEMVSTGTFAFADFRESGPDGVDLLLEAMQGIDLVPRILGRPDQRCPDGGCPDRGSFGIHPECWGLGISSTRDFSPSSVLEMAGLARSECRAVALHAGEAGADDIRDALELGPKFLVHMCRASKEDLREVARSGTPVVICPRSNLITGAGLPDLRTMVELGITVSVGTDNVMLNSPDMFREMELISKALLHDDRQVFKMCTINGARVLDIDGRSGSIEAGKEGKLMVIDDKSNNMWGSADPLAAIVRRAGPSDIKAIF